MVAKRTCQVHSSENDLNRYASDLIFEIDVMRKIPFLLLTIPLIVSLFLFHPLLSGAQAEDGDCTELIINGNMESDAGWTFPVTALQGSYSTEQYFSPFRSARLGIVSGENKYAYSSMNQSVTIPSGTQLILSWHTFPLSQPLDSSDLQYVQIRDKNGELHTIWSDRRNDTAWLTCSYDISDYLDQNITLYFGVKNDGANGRTGLYVDDVTLQVCTSPQTVLAGCQPSQTTPTPVPTPSPTPTANPTLTPTATPMPTPTPSPTPPPCQQLIQNPNFDQGYTGWQQNLYFTARYQDEMGEEHTGAWFGGAEYTDQYLYQDVMIPDGSPASHITFLWAFAPPTHGAPAPGDNLTITLRQPDDTVLQTLTIIDAASTPRRWQTSSFDISPYIGKTVRFHAQSTTGASTTSWYLDQIQLFNCASVEHTTYLPWIRK